MHSHDVAVSVSTVDLCVADVRVRVDAPERIVRVLEATLLHVPRFPPSAEPEIIVSVFARGDVWEISDMAGERKVLAAQSALPRVAGAVVTSIVNNAAALRNYTTLRATVVERDGRALAMIGDDWESAVTIAAHLHGRGWTFIGSDNAMLQPSSGTVFSVQKSLYVNASSLAQLPNRYRRAVEASPWYVTPQGISFYAVDPKSVGGGPAWSDSATLCGVLIVDGLMADSPSLEPVGAKRLAGGPLADYATDSVMVEVADLRIGGYIETCDLIEQWFRMRSS